MNAAALSPESFEARYEGGRDPWCFAQDAYELGRYRTLMTSLRRASYQTVYEPGCSVGVLTEQLAAVARRVIATDFAPSAVAQAQRRCANNANVQVICGDVRTYVPGVRLDLVVFSEIGYYFTSEELSDLAGQLSECLVPGGEFIAAHWLGESADHVLHGNRVHAILAESLGLQRLRSDVHPGFRLDSWTKS